MLVFNCHVRMVAARGASTRGDAIAVGRCDMTVEPQSMFGRSTVDIIARMRDAAADRSRG